MTPLTPCLNIPSERKTQNRIIAVFATNSGLFSSYAAKPMRGRPICSEPFPAKTSARE